MNVKRWNLWIWCCSSVSSSDMMSSPTMHTCAPSYLEETYQSPPRLGRGRQQEKMQMNTIQRTMMWKWRYGPGIGAPHPPSPTRTLLGDTFRRIIWWWKGDHFLVVFPCYKAHLSPLLTHEKHLSYNLPFLELPLAYSKTINEKIWQAIRFFFGSFKAKNMKLAMGNSRKWFEVVILP